MSDFLNNCGFLIVFIWIERENIFVFPGVIFYRLIDKLG